MSTEWNDLEHRLRDLGSDIGGAPLPGPDAARRRARQRTRRQVAGATLGAVAAAAIGVAVLGGLGPMSISQPEPADTPTPTPSQSPTGDAIEPGDELMLTVEDLEASYADPELAAQIGWEPADPPSEPLLCAPTAGADTVSGWFRTADDGYLNQFIEISTADAAQARFDAVIDEVLSCVEERNAENPDDNWLNVVWTVDGIGDSLWTADYAVPPRGPNGELMIVQVSVVLTGDAITVVTQAGLGMEAHNVGPLPYQIAMAAADRLCTSAGRDCIGDPVPQRVHPPVNSDAEPGWLTIDDIVTAMPYFETIGEVGAIHDGDGYGHICMEAVNPVAAGATAVSNRQYTDPLDPTLETDFFEHIARFESDQAARAHYDDVVNAVEGCGAQQIGTTAGPGYEGVGWLAEDEFAPFHLGVAVNGSDVAVIVLGQPWSSHVELPPDQTLELLGRVGTRLGDLE
ncbi:MAG TPA: hypothetical protein VFZ85_16260 [Jiangellaceae bacterium]